MPHARHRLTTVGRVTAERIATSSSGVSASSCTHCGTPTDSASTTAASRRRGGAKRHRFRVAASGGSPWRARTQIRASNVVTVQSPVLGPLAPRTRLGSTAAPAPSGRARPPARGRRARRHRAARRRGRPRHEGYEPRAAEAQLDRPGPAQQLEEVPHPWWSQLYRSTTAGDSSSVSSPDSFPPPKGGIGKETNRSGRVPTLPMRGSPSLPMRMGTIPPIFGGPWGPISA